MENISNEAISTLNHKNKRPKSRIDNFWESHQKMHTPSNEQHEEIKHHQVIRKGKLQDITSIFSYKKLSQINKGFGINTKLIEELLKLNLSPMANLILTIERTA
ncbi:hypothetical protein F8M41_002784 [Gigaspora margarita]|uniref:Uncharacterized protein n=1 Tax=Gigaspora margarita TaxID=4874 RepID=A0A8H3XDS5_GIGMA|nr:hypothetical protein F8M41_002784 [Gigaspora margarita]